MLEFFMGHQFFYSAGHSLDVVHDKFVQVGIPMLGVDNQGPPNSVPSRIVVIEFGNICDV